VFVASTRSEVEHALDQLFRARSVGEAADHVLMEEYLEGPELSLLAFTDGERLAVMPPARDYKRLLDGDRGPNTGGMGGYTRPDYASAKLLSEVESTILQPTVDGMAAEGEPYQGVLYAGLIITRNGPKVLEFNCRFGDPECQLILPLLGSPLSEICGSVVDQRLRPEAVRWRQGRTCGVVLAAGGYPEAPVLGETIHGLDALPENVYVFHAGTRREADRLVTAGGRVLTLVGFSREAVYRAAETVQFPGKQFRKDIGVVDVPGAVGTGVNG
jgi:phosphoribosylamine--glycine ligase